MVVERSVLIPSRSRSSGLLPAPPPVTNAREPETVVPSCLTPFEVVWAGSARCQRPSLAVSVPSGFAAQPLVPSASSKKAPQLTTWRPAAWYGHAPCWRNQMSAERLRAVCRAMFSSAG